MEIKPQVPPTPPPTAAPAPPPTAPVDASAPHDPKDWVVVNVPMEFPKELVTPDAKGHVPIQDFTPTLLPPGYMTTTQKDVDELVTTVRKQAAPPGTHPEINPSAAGHKVDVAKQTVVKLSNVAGGLATYSLMRNGAGFLAIPTAIAAPLALAGGAIGTIAGLDQTREALNLKGYYEGLKNDGVNVIPIQVPVQTKDGVQVETRQVPVDDLIKGARDAAVVGGIQTGSSILMAVAGIGGGPPVAIASIALSAAGALYAARGQFALVFKAAWEKIKSHFHHDGEKGAEPAPPAQAPAGTPAPTPAPPPAPVPPPAPPQEAIIADPLRATSGLAG